MYSKNNEYYEDTLYYNRDKKQYEIRTNKLIKIIPIDCKHTNSEIVSYLNQYGDRKLKEVCVQCGKTTDYLNPLINPIEDITNKLKIDYLKNILK